MIYGVLASDVGLDIRKRVGDIQAHVDLMDLASNATQVPSPSRHPSSSHACTVCGVCCSC